MQTPVLRYFPPNHSNFCYLASSARVWIFFVEVIFTFSRMNCRILGNFDLTWYRTQFCLSVSFTKTWKFFRIPHVFSIFWAGVAISSNWANCQQKLEPAGETLRWAGAESLQAVWALSNVNIETQGRNSYYRNWNRISPKK